jgi:hypothetical protein
MSDDDSEAVKIADTYGGELYDPKVHGDLGEPDDEQAYEDVVGIDDAPAR